MELSLLLIVIGIVLAVLVHYALGIALILIGLVLLDLAADLAPGEPVASDRRAPSTRLRRGRAPGSGGPLRRGQRLGVVQVALDLGPVDLEARAARAPR